MQKIILVGQAPGRHAKSKEPLDEGCGRRLSALAGLDHAEFLRRFERANLIDDYPGAVAKGDKFDVRAARDRADLLRERWRGRRVVLLGRGVAAAFRLVPDDYEWFKPIEAPPGIELAVMPHPSGISHWWNDPANVAAARDFMLRLKVLEPPTRQTTPGVEKFTEDEVAAALEAGRGVHTWAARVLAEETGLSCTSQTIANYIERYPALAEIAPVQKNRMLDAAEHNVVRSVEKGDMDTSRWLLRSQMAMGRGYALAVQAKVNGHMQHDVRAVHLHARLSGAGLDLSRYSDEQLQAIEEFASVLGAGPEPE